MISTDFDLLDDVDCATLYSINTTDLDNADYTFIHESKDECDAQYMVETMLERCDIVSFNHPDLILKDSKNNLFYIEM